MDIWGVPLPPRGHRAVFPFLLVFMLGISLSLSLSLAGLLLPSTSEPIVEHGRLLDAAFNASYSEFVQLQTPCGRAVPQAASWTDWAIDRISTQPPDPDCEPMAYCIPAFQRLIPTLLPSTLAAKVLASARVVAVRIWLERRATKSLEWFWTQVTFVRSWAITFVSDHALAFIVCYICFPGRAIMSCLKLLTKVSRTSA